jgi:prepilin-type processing-associated H-X9-DG protein
MVTIGGKKYPRTRSISMNGCVNENSWHTALIDRQWWTYRKMTDIRSPSTKFVFIDEREDSVDDGYILVLVDRPPEWEPARALPRKASGLAFADGHAEIKRWMDPGHDGQDGHRSPERAAGHRLDQRARQRAEVIVTRHD